MAAGQPRPGSELVKFQAGAKSRLGGIKRVVLVDVLEQIGK